MKCNILFFIFNGICTFRIFNNSCNSGTALVQHLQFQNSTQTKVGVYLVNFTLDGLCESDEILQDIMLPLKFDFHCLSQTQAEFIVYNLPCSLQSNGIHVFHHALFHFNCYLSFRDIYKTDIQLKISEIERLSSKNEDLIERNRTSEQILYDLQISNKKVIAEKDKYKNGHMDLQKR